MQTPEVVYLCGPMTDRPLWGFQTFENVACKLRSQGFHVISPHDIDIDDGRVKAEWSTTVVGAPRQFTSVVVPEDFDREATLRVDFMAVLNADGVVMLPDWDVSDGACKERTIAQWSGRAVGLWDPLHQRVIWREKSSAI